MVVASLGDGRVLRRLKGVSGNTVKSLAASPDGQTIYYASDGVACPPQPAQPFAISPLRDVDDVRMTTITAPVLRVAQGEDRFQSVRLKLA